MAEESENTRSDDLSVAPQRATINEHCNDIQVLLHMQNNEYQIVCKCGYILTDRILGVYVLGNTIRDISNAWYEQFGNHILAETISSVINHILLEIQS